MIAIDGNDEPVYCGVFEPGGGAFWNCWLLPAGLECDATTNIDPDEPVTIHWNQFRLLIDKFN